jgi:gliding motility-associated-like protein
MPKLKLRIAVGLLFIVFGASELLAQTSYSGQNWYFGNSIYGIRFSRPNQNPVLDDTHKSPPFGRFGNSTANEPETGNLLFYTDGQLVFDGSFSLMSGIIAGTSELDADINRNQNTAIVAVPGNNDRYFIFTNTPGNNVHVSLVDMTNPGNAIFPQPALGSVTSFNSTIAQSTATTSDAMLAIAKSDLSGYWLITVDQNTSNYKVLDIDGPNPGSWTETTYNLGLPVFAAHLTYSPATDKIAVAPKNQNVNVQILDIDPATGVLSYDTEILNSGNADFATEAVYDAEWSADGTKLYISRYGGAAGVGDVLQWDSNAPPSASLVSVLPAQVFGSYGLQIGPDNNVYHLYQATGAGPFLVGQINDADSVASLTNYVPTVFSNENFNGFQFPAILPPRLLQLTVDFTFAGTCANVATSFYPIIDPPADTVFWDFGDGTGSSSLLAPIYTYTAGGTFNVQLFARLNGQTRSTSKPITITDFDLQLTLPSDTVACQCELPKYGLPTPCPQFQVQVQAQSQSGVSPTYLWSNGETGDILHPDSAGYYYVVATDIVSGCSTYAGVNVQEYGAADQRANIWYFGENAGIDFNPPATTALSDGIMDAPEGCTAISDRNGQILFYTDGNDVFIKDEATGTHSLVETGIGGSPNASQSVIAVPFANDETLYYIFTTEEVGTGLNNYAFKYSVYDIKANGGVGDIIEKNITLFTKSTERIAATANWVVIHEYGNNNFRAYAITPNGLSAPVVTSMGADHFTTSAPEATAQGYMTFGASKLAVALSESLTGPSFIDVFDWNDQNGQVTNYEQIDLDADGAVNAQVYGLAFSPAGNKLFATVKSAGGPSLLMEYRADSLDRLNFINSIPDGNELGAIQIAPDGQLYVAVEGASSLGIIQVNEDTVSNSTFNLNGFALAGGTRSRLGLPNFVQAFGTAATAPGMFVSSPVCLGQPISLSANTTSVIDTVYWQITDAANLIVFTSQNLTDTVTLSTAGDFLVSLRIGNRCGLDSAFSQTITVTPPPQNSTLPAGLPLCGTSTTLDPYDVDPPDIADLSFLWSTGETTRTIIVTNQGPYDVTITNDVSGCTNAASVFVGPPFLVDVGPDLTICESDPLVMDSQANASTYTWLIDGVPVVPANNQRTFDFGAKVLPGGVYTVRVEVVDPVDPSCIVIDEAIITVNAQPAIGVPVITSATCGNADGAIDFIITNAGTGSYTFDLSGPVILTNQPIVAGAGNVSALPAGIYIITVFNVVSGCTNTLGGVIVDEQPTLFNLVSALEFTPDGCVPPPSGEIEIIIDNAGAFPIDYILRDEATNNIVSQANGIPDAGGLNFIISGLPAGTYSIELDPTGCTVFDNGIVVNPTPVSDLQVNNTISGCDVIDLSTQGISSSTGATIEWSYDDIVYNSLTTLIDPTNDGQSFGQFDIFVRAQDPAAVMCDSLRQVPITLVPTPTAFIDVDNSQICDGVSLLTAVGDGGYAGAQLEYRWSPNGETSQTISATQDNVTYTVSVNNVLNQSCFVSESTLVLVPQPFTVSITSTLACDDDKPFTLTATATIANVDYSWTLDGIDIPGNSIITTNKAGLYEATATDNINPGNCSSSAILNVIKAPVTPTDLSSALVFCPDEGSVTLDAGTGFINYQWSTGETTQSIVISAEGIYKIDATNNFGCITEDQTEVLEDCIPKVYGPNAFRPGGINDTFFLFTQYLDEFDIFIYSRWGELVYHSSNKDFTWNGVYNDQLLPAGQYTWVVRYTSSFRDRGLLEQYGGVTLLR